MSISDMIVLMKEGAVQQIDAPQKVYDDPVNLFVAKFLGTPAINVFKGKVSRGRLYIGNDNVMGVGNVPDCEVYATIRPEGFIPDPEGTLTCKLAGIEVLGRDLSIVAENEAAESERIRAIVASAENIDRNSGKVTFSIKPDKLFLFNIDTEERITFDHD